MAEQTSPTPAKVSPPLWEIHLDHLIQIGERIMTQCEQDADYKVREVLDDLERLWESIERHHERHPVEPSATMPEAGQ